MKIKDKEEERGQFFGNLCQVQDISTLLSINNFNEMLGNDETRIKKLGDVMEYDQAIAVKLLQRIPDGVEVSTLAQIRSETLRLRLFLLNAVKVDGNTIRDRSYSLANFIKKAESS